MPSCTAIVLYIVFFITLPLTFPILIIGIYCPSVMECCCCCLGPLKHDIITLFVLVKYFFWRMHCCGSPYNALSDQQCGYQLPRYWSDPQIQQEKLSQFKNQIAASAQSLSSSQQETMMNAPDSNIQCLKLLDAYDTLSPSEKRNMELLHRVYTQPDTYDFEQEGLYGENYINGENPFALERLTYDSNNQFQKRIYETFNKSNKQINTFGLQFSIKLSNLESQVKKTQDLLLMDFRLLRELYKQGPQPIQNQQMIEGKIYMHIPYAIFAPARFNKQTKYVLLAVAFKFKQNQIRVYTPFIESTCSIRLWNIVRLHTSVSHFNDFTFKTHLGILHFKTSQYNVPLYNFIRNTRNERVKELLYHVYTPFNSGLEGVNLPATSTLIHYKYAVAEKVFFMRRNQALQYLKMYQQDFNILDYEPRAMINKNGLQCLNIKGNHLYYDIVLYDIIGKFIEDSCDLCKLEECQQQILELILRQVPQDNSKITSVRKLLKNLMFAWVIYHVHTRSNLSIATFYQFRPSMLIRPLPAGQPTEDDLNWKKYIPSPPTLVNCTNLARSVTILDRDNFLLPNFRDRREKIKNNQEWNRIYGELITSLEAVSKEVQQVCQQRMKNNLFEFEWLDPQIMESSLNI